MTPDLADRLIPGLAEAEAAVADARRKLDQARAATTAAEELCRERQAQEATILQVYEQATDGVREALAAERQRLEEAKRTAEDRLRILESKAKALADGTTIAIPSITPQPDDRTDEAGDDPAAGSDDSAYEDNWYRTLLQQAQAERDEGEDLSDVG